jgi:hypothetical protein
MVFSFRQWAVRTYSRQEILDFISSRHIFVYPTKSTATLAHKDSHPTLIQRSELLAVVGEAPTDR